MNKLLASHETNYMKGKWGYSASFRLEALKGKLYLTKTEVPEGALIKPDKKKMVTKRYSPSGMPEPTKKCYWKI